MRVLNFNSQGNSAGVTLTSLVVSLKIAAMGYRVLYINNSQKSGVLGYLKVELDSFRGDITPYLMSNTLRYAVVRNSVFTYNKNLDLLDNKRNLISEEVLAKLIQVCNNEYEVLVVDNGTNGLLVTGGLDLINIQVIPMGLDTKDLGVLNNSDYVAINRVEPLPEFEEEVVIDFRYIVDKLKGKKEEEVEDLVSYAYSLEGQEEVGFELPYFSFIEKFIKSGDVLLESDFKQNGDLERFLLSDLGIEEKLVEGGSLIAKIKNYQKKRNMGEKLKKSKGREEKVEEETVDEVVLGEVVVEETEVKNKTKEVVERADGDLEGVSSVEEKSVKLGRGGWFW